MYGWLLFECSLLGTWPTTQACVLTGNQTGDPLVPSPALNPLEPQQLWLHASFEMIWLNPFTSKRKKLTLKTEIFSILNS